MVEKSQWEYQNDATYEHRGITYLRPAQFIEAVGGDLCSLFHNSKLIKTSKSDVISLHLNNLGFMFSLKNMEQNLRLRESIHIIDVFTSHDPFGFAIVLYSNEFPGIHPNEESTLYKLENLQVKGEK